MSPISHFSFRKRIKSFTHAFRGAGTLLRTQHNAWIHLAAAVGVIAAGFRVGITATGWALLTIAIALVWMAEALNTALEFLADEVSMEKREGIKRAKDVAAFGVLVAALAALVIGAIVFLPYCLPAD